MELEEIEELKDFTIDITDIDELALGLEVCSKKSNMVIQEFANLIIELEQQNKKYKEVIDKVIEITNKILMNNADNRMICNEEEKEYFDWLDSEMLKQEKILKGSDSNE